MTLGAPDHPDTRTQCLVPSSALYQSSENNAHYLQQIFQKNITMYVHMTLFYFIL